MNPTNPPSQLRPPPVLGEAGWRLPVATVPGPIPEPVCRWTFQEPAGEPRWSTGRERYALREMAGPVARSDDGPSGAHALELTEGKWLSLPRAECPALNFHGAGARFSLVAWIKRRQKSVDECEAIAGMWNETLATRQYCLFLNLQIWDSADQIGGHLSATGKPTPPYKYCMETAVGATRLGFGDWHHAAFTFDGAWGRVYVDGKLDYRPGLNPYFWPRPINHGGPDGSDFTVGAVFRNGEVGNWFVGSLGGLAVYDEALSEEAVSQLHLRRMV
jgi:hypothetical protein